MKQKIKKLLMQVDKELIIDDKTAKKYINNLIEINPDKQEHKDFIMKFIKELKR